MKMCCRCKQELPYSAFHKGKAKDGYAYACRSCKKVQDAESHARNRVERLAKRRNDQSGRKAWLRSLKEIPCVDCGIQYPWYVTHWDHLPGHVKLFEIGDGRHRSKALLIEEIAKCELVCANCHAIRTYERRLSVSGNTSVS